MYVFSRQRNIDPGRLADAVGGIKTLAAKVTELTGQTVTTWSATFTPTGPAVVATARFDSLADYQHLMDTVMASGEYLDLLAEANESFVGAPIDNLIHIVAGNLPSRPLPVAVVVQAAAMPGHYRSAVHWGSHCAESIGRALNVPVVFGTGMFGQYGTLVWGSYYDDLAGYETTNAKLGTDDMLQAIIDEGAHNCQPGAVQFLMRQLT